MIRQMKKSEATDGTHVRMKETGKQCYEFEEFVNQKGDEVIEGVQQVKLMERRGDMSQQRQIDHVGT